MFLFVVFLFLARALLRCCLNTLYFHQVFHPRISKHFVGRNETLHRIYEASNCFFFFISPFSRYGNSGSWDLPDWMGLVHYPVYENS